MANSPDDAGEMILVPRVPTAEMIEAAGTGDAVGIWNRMVERWLQMSQRPDGIDSQFGPLYVE